MAPLNEKRTMYKTLCDEPTPEVDVLYLLRRNVLSLSQLENVLLPAVGDEMIPPK